MTNSTVAFRRKSCNRRSPNMCLLWCNRTRARLAGCRMKFILNSLEIGRSANLIWCDKLFFLMTNYSTTSMIKGAKIRFYMMFSWFLFMVSYDFLGFVLWFSCDFDHFQPALKLGKTMTFFRVVFSDQIRSHQEQWASTNWEGAGAPGLGVSIVGDLQ